LTIDDDETWRENPEAASGTKPRALRVVSHDPRPDILCTPAVHVTTERMADVLTGDPELYKRAGALAHVIRVAAEDEVPGVPVGSPIIRDTPLSWLVNRVSRLARCVKPGKKGAITVPPPPACVRAVLEAGAWPGVRNLRGMIEAPALRPDGTVIQTPGYDRATGYLYEPNAAFPVVADEPSKGDATRAFAHLAELFVDFPFVGPAHLSATVAALLTLLARPAILGAVPAWAFDASGPRQGKSLQVDVIHIIATGRAASRMTFPETDEELEKVLAGYAMNGAAVVPFDNVARPFGGAALDKVVTAVGRVDLRVLGSNDLRTVDWLAVVLASGNQFDFKGDMIARVLAPRLETTLDRAEQRSDFRIPDLRAHVRERRAELVADALTILRGYVVAGRPDMGCPKWGGFEQWAALIPHAIRWAGADDPMGARRGLDGDADPDAMARAAVVAGWAKLCDVAGRPDGLTIKQAIAVLYPPRHHGEDLPPDGLDDLREVVEMITNAKPGFPPATKTLADRIRRWKNRPTNGRKLAGETASAGTIRWKVVRA
jgi:hypothetical protein